MRVCGHTGGGHYSQASPQGENTERCPCPGARDWVFLTLVAG